MRVDRSSVVAGMLADLAVLAPVVALYAALRGLGIVTASGAAVDVTAVIGGLVAPAAGGVVAGRRQTAAPLTNGAAAGGLSSVAYLAFRIIDGLVRHKPLNVAAGATLVIIAMTLGMLGGWAGFRSASHPPLADSNP
jgi:hypothetical protein